MRETRIETDRVGPRSELDIVCRASWLFRRASNHSLILGFKYLHVDMCDPL